MSNQTADLIVYNGKIATENEQRSIVEAVAVRDGKFLAVGSDREVMGFRDQRTKLIDLNKRTVIPGLNDSHLHLIRGGLNYNLELRWDGVPSLADGLRMLREQAQRTPPGQ
jgi:predicted amidohydrolase YtcJ